MKIEITGRLASGANTPAALLCTSTPTSDSEPTGPLEGWSLSVPSAIQTSHPVRSTYVQHFHRGGRIARLTFSCYRKFTSRRDAESFCFTHAASIPQGGTVVITTDGDAGSQVRTIANAEVAEPAFTNLGRLVQISYSIIGAAIT